MTERPEPRPVPTTEPGRVGITAVKVPDHELVVDRDRVAAMREQREQAEAGPLWKRLLRAVGQSVLGAALFTSATGRNKPLPEALRLFGLIVPMTVALGVAISVLIPAWMHRQASRQTLDQELTRLQREWDQFHGPRWWVSPLKWGVFLGVSCTAIVVGFITVMEPVRPVTPPSDLSLRTGLVNPLKFMALTLLWSVPMGFVIRAMVKGLMRRLMKPKFF